MSEIVANWIDITRFGNLEYEEQLDANCAPGANLAVLYRHRERRYTTQPEAEWKAGPAPRKPS